MPYNSQQRRASYLREMADPARCERRRVQVRAAQKKYVRRHAAAIKVLNQKRRAETKELVRLYKTQNPCAECGIHYPYYVMDLDHVRGKKVTNLGSGALGSSIRLTIEEIEKCDVVCANCHRERTHQRAQEKAA